MELYPVSQIVDNATYPGLLHNAFMTRHPVLLSEVGAARILDHELIARFVEGTLNVLKHHGIVAGKWAAPARTCPPLSATPRFQSSPPRAGSWNTLSDSMIRSSPANQLRSSVTVPAR